ncbi:EAL domain-containing protein [Desertibacillus haloalkaliphilus]|uniref:EAL domain-containing protein n=1 Tax=Desertibacillus haloalkaliphilus TaxID=1328930 RepID=UPI001C269BFB|nr:EAL domain-containing protein [Desertibacillus haloalkaliphilus]MBU8906420.1 EAL domain-containing protein [Desertibacillus haloalkaliphilus]
MLWRLVPKWVVNAIGRISFSKKFILFFLAFIIPLISVKAYLLVDIKSKINQNETEQMALESLQHVATLLEHTQYHRGLNQSYLRGYEEFSDSVQERQELINSKIMVIDYKVKNEWDDFFNQEQWSIFNEQWQRVKTITNPRRNYVEHNELNQGLLSLVSHIIEETQMYMNPDPQMNRLSDVLNEDLLLATERIGQLRAFTSRLTMEDRLSDKQQAELLMMIGGVKDSLTTFGLKTSYIFIGEFDDRYNLANHVEDFKQETSEVIEAVENNIFLLYNPEQVFLYATSAIDSGFSIYERGNLLLTEHLKNQQKLYKFNQMLIFGFVLLSVLIVFFLFGGMYVSVIETIKSLQKGTQRWISGDLSARVDIRTGNELKYIGDSFNELARNFEIKIEEYNEAQQELKQSLLKNNQLVTAINNLEIGVIITDPTHPDHPITFVNPGFEKLTGYKAEEVLGRYAYMLHGERTTPESIQKLEEGIAKEEPFSVEILNYRKDGTTFWNLLSIAPVYEDGKLVNFLGLQTDMTKQKQADEKIYSLAYYDQLTNLPNDNKLAEVVRDDIDSGIKEATVLFLDVIRFKFVNHSRGFTLGNQTLKEIANRLERVMKDNGVVSRQYGDKFTIYIQDSAEQTFINETITQICDQFREPFEIEGHTFFLEVAIGVSQFPEGGKDFNVLLQQAEAAMYTARKNDDKDYVYYEEHMQQDFELEYDLENKLRVAVERNELFLTYQPKQDLNTGEITGMEALLRWDHPQLGVVSPFRFIPIAESTGLIYDIGRWVLFEACKQNKQWQEQGVEPLVVSVNISAKQFKNDYLLPMIDQVLVETQLDPTYLEIELTESVFQNPSEIKPLLDEVRERGIHISIDDFGTGYSSLNYLKQFPIDVLKVDRAFVKDLLEDERDRRLTKSMIEMGQGLGFKVIAEGAETSEHIDKLREYGCNEVQGYYVSKPLQAEEFYEFVKRRI